MEGDILTQVAGEVDVTIYTDVSNLPGALVFTKAFQSQPDEYQGWQGTTGFAGTLAAGSYWIAFEVPAGSTFAGDQGAYPISPPHPHVPRGR